MLTISGVWQGASPDTVPDGWMGRYVVCVGLLEVDGKAAEVAAFDLQAHKERLSGYVLSYVLVGRENIAVVHGDKRRDRRDQALLVGARDE
jgi:hypothetical protein